MSTEEEREEVGSMGGAGTRRIRGRMVGLRSVRSTARELRMRARTSLPPPEYTARLGWGMERGWEALHKCRLMELMRRDPGMDTRKT